MSLVDIHLRLSYASILFAIIMALWGLWRYYRKEGIDSNFRGALVIAEILFLFQVLFGIFLWLSGSGHLSRPTVHLLYGVVSVMVLPGVFLYSKGNEGRQMMAIYGIAFIFTLGIITRGIMTGV